jgi:adenine phosphoribosyltransferase
VHADAIKPNWKVIVHDDLLATGGTAAAAAELIKSQGASIEAFSFLVELSFLNGKDTLSKYGSQIKSLATY